MHPFIEKLKQIQSEYSREIIETLDEAKFQAIEAAKQSVNANYSVDSLLGIYDAMKTAEDCIFLKAKKPGAYTQFFSSEKTAYSAITAIIWMRVMSLVGVKIDLATQNKILNSALMKYDLDKQQEMADIPQANLEGYAGVFKKPTKEQFEDAQQKRQIKK